MLNKVRVSIVIPTLNEGKNIRRVIMGIRKAMANYAYEIIVVDGRSFDNTAGMAKRLGARVLYDNVGKGNALIKGLNAAKGEILISMDADLSNNPQELKLLIESIEVGYEVCMGSRFIAGGSTEDMTPIRRLGNELFVFLVNMLFSSNYTDMCYGYRSFRRDVLRRLKLTEKGFGIETEINIKAAKLGLKTIEVPSEEKKRIAGEGKLNTFRDGYVIFTTILKNII